MSDVDANAYLSQNDYLTWSVRDAMKHPTQMNEDPDMLAYRIILINFAAVPSSAFTSAGTLLDIYSSPPSKGFVSGLREEVENLVHKKSGDWTKGDVDNLIRIDSAIKESMRLETTHGQGTRAQGCLKRRRHPQRWSEVASRSQHCQFGLLGPSR